MQLHTLAFTGEEDEENKHKITRELWDKCEECVASPGEWKRVEGFGSRVATSSSNDLRGIKTKSPNLHRSESSSGCVVATAANALVDKSEFDAASLDVGEGEDAKTLGALAQRISEKCPSWALLSEATTVGREEGGRKSWPAKEKVKWLLKQEEGMFIVQPFAKGASNTHIVAVDAGAGLLHDPMEPVAWKLCEEPCSIHWKA